MAFEAKVSIKGVQQIIADLKKIGPAGEEAAKKLEAALNKAEMGKGLEKLGEQAKGVFEKISEGISAITGTKFGEGAKIFDEISKHALSAGKSLFSAFSQIRSGSSEASSGVKKAGEAAAEAGQAAATGGGGFASVIGILARFAAPVLGVVAAVASAAVAVGVLTYKAGQAGAEILDLAYAAGATAEDTQRMGAAADRAAIPFRSMAEIAKNVRSGFREASLAADSVVESWEVMKERVATAAEGVAVAETEQAESAISSAQAIKDAKQEVADAAIESAEQQIDAANRVVDAQNAVQNAQSGVADAQAEDQKSEESQARAEQNEYKSEKRSKEDLAEKYFDLNDRHKQGKISDEDYKKENAKLAKEEQRAKEDQAQRQQELAEKRAELERKRAEARQKQEAQNALRKALEELTKALDKQKDTEHKGKERQEKAGRKLEDAERKRGEEEEKAQKQVDRSHTMQDRIAAGRDEFARQTEINSPALLRLFSGFTNIGDPGGEDAYRGAKAKLREFNKLGDSEQLDAVFAERSKYIAAHGGVVDQNIIRFDNDISGGSARHISEHAGEVQRAFEEPISKIDTENNENRFPSTPKLNAEGHIADSAQRTQTHLEDGLIHGIGGSFAKIFDALSPPAEHAGESLEGVHTKADEAGSSLGAFGAALKKALADFGNATEEGGGAEGHAAGGLISGPGTGTSDSIPANLSTGEYVVNAATVSRLGVPFMHALNSGKGFSTGGLVGAFESASGYHREARRFASGGLADAAGGGHPVTFMLDGKSFGGFSGSKGAVEQLSRHAVMQQVGAIGRRPSHAR